MLYDVVQKYFHRVFTSLRNFGRVEIAGKTNLAVTMQRLIGKKRDRGTLKQYVLRYQTFDADLQQMVERTVVRKVDDDHAMKPIWISIDLVAVETVHEGKR